MPDSSSTQAVSVFWCAWCNCGAVVSSSPKNTVTVSPDAYSSRKASGSKAARTVGGCSSMINSYCSAPACWHTSGSEVPERAAASAIISGHCSSRVWASVTSKSASSVSANAVSCSVAAGASGVSNVSSAVSVGTSSGLLDVQAVRPSVATKASAVPRNQEEAEVIMVLVYSTSQMNAAMGTGKKLSGSSCHAAYEWLRSQNEFLFILDE